MQKILIIDDEKDMVNMLTEYFAGRGYAISQAYDGEEGIQKFDSEKPDIVLCDIKMPKKDGFEFLKEIRASKKW
ncbi:MAG: response regulator, partial [Candidatus Omnitrophica bacterium]|nr:response regulator [Candidatus Omnitrophota bacterium]